MIDALIIVDMQKYFLDQLSVGTMTQNRKAVTKLVEAVNKQATWAMEHKVPIIVLEYDTEDESGNQSRTDWRIRRNLQFYKRKWYAMKDTDDGGEEVLEVMHGCEPRRGLVEKHRLVNLAGRKDEFTFNICGVNLDACVYETANSLLCDGHAVRLVHEATRNTWDNRNAKNTREDARKLMDYECYKIIKNVA